MIRRIGNLNTGEKNTKNGRITLKNHEETDEDLKENRNKERREGNSTDHFRQETKNIRIGLVQK